MKVIRHNDIGLTIESKESLSLNEIRKNSNVTINNYIMN